MDVFLQKSQIKGQNSHISVFSPLKKILLLLWMSFDYFLVLFQTVNRFSVMYHVNLFSSLHSLLKYHLNLLMIIKDGRFFHHVTVLSAIWKGLILNWCKGLILEQYLIIFFFKQTLKWLKVSPGLLCLALSFLFQVIWSGPMIGVDFWDMHTGRCVSDGCLKDFLVHMGSRSHVFG